MKITIMAKDIDTCREVALMASARVGFAQKPFTIPSEVTPGQWVSFALYGSKKDARRCLDELKELKKDHDFKYFFHG